LAWTGTGEPPIPKANIEDIKRHFEGEGNRLRLGFDWVIRQYEKRNLCSSAVVNIHLDEAGIM